MKLWMRIVFIFIGFFESLTITGIIFGWPALLHVFQIEGIYSHLCLEEDAQNGNGTAQIAANTSVTTVIRCAKQDNMYGLLYTVMIGLYGIPSALIGFSLDSLGLRFTRICGSTMMMAGYAFVAYATQDTPWTVWPGMLAISLGSNALRLCSLQCGNAWPEKRATIMFCYTSAHAASTLVFLMFQYANAAGVSLYYTGIFMTAFSGLSFFASFILPKIKVEENKASPPKDDPVKDIDLQILPVSDTDKQVNSEPEKPKVIPLSESVKTMSFAFHNIWLLNIYMTRFYITSFNTWAWKTTSDPNQIAFYNSFTGLCLLISPFISPVGGIITDYLLNKASKKSDPVERLASTFQAPIFILTTTTFLMFAVYVCKVSYSSNAVYASIVLISIVRPVSVASLYSYVRIRFYPEHFNRLTGIAFTIISIVSLLLYPQYLWLFYADESYAWASYTFCFLILLTFSSPGHLLISRFPRRFAAQEIKNRK
ncbi:solute carrier family 43 member 3 [Folsomia candida]|uniref:Large neutral amino acids transporter small subunit 3 n=1 Tax=Folsomia candida TaxID=158441 RepID=A0A226DWY6_FOLCA|nr:solute carrier family 43 member 3 [Folsomia candida]OXA49773.1 Large neutral amino acids transporter small subunit 3 [Folsomia candida]